MLKKIFVFIILLLPLGEVIRINFGNGITLRPLDIGVGILALIWIVSKLFKKKRVERKKLYIPILFFAGFGGLSLLINYSNLTPIQFFVSAMYLARWIIYAAIFFIALDFDNKFKTLISKILLAISSLIVCLGYIQYFFYSSLRNLYYLGWDEHMYRMFSVFLDPNFAGAFFVLFFIFLVNSYFKNKNILIGLLSILTLGAVFLTFSRSALIMLIVSSSILFILMKKKVWIAILSGIILLVVLISSRYFNIENINLFRVVSSEARLESAKDALIIFKNNPIFGVGFNSYRYAQQRYNLRSGIFVTSHADAGADNSMLFVLATTGVIGFAVYLFIWFRFIKIASSLGIASIAGIFVSSMFINSLFYPFIMLWLWIILALSIKNHN